MTPEEKKNELIEKFKPLAYGVNEDVYTKYATQCAIIAVKEIIEEKYDFFRLLYWQEVLTLLKKEE